MDGSLTHDLSTCEFASFLPSAHLEQFLQFPPNLPSSHPFLFGETPLTAYTLHSFSTPVPTVPTSYPAMDTLSSTPSARSVCAHVADDAAARLALWLAHLRLQLGLGLRVPGRG
ncbi:hypothetical protein FRC09_005025 [Ceratobasidium sp. 395]|nr:hypothetical protein FRC09_005025 [Ceratobasidium sp. 395]